jgi:hypothetical protein
MHIITPDMHIKQKPPYRYLCPIGRKNPKLKHYHGSYVPGLFDHLEIIGKGIASADLGIMIWKDPERGKKYYRLISVHITALVPNRRASDGNK